MGWKHISVAGCLSAVLLAGCGMETSSSVAATPSAAAAALVAPLPTAEERETAVPTIDLEAPKQVVETFASHIRDQNYAAVEPLMTDLLRDAFVKGAGSVEAGFRMGDERDGKLVSYSIGSARALGVDAAAVDVELISERRTTANTIELVIDNGSWKIANITPR